MLIQHADKTRKSKNEVISKSGKEKVEERQYNTTHHTTSMQNEGGK